MTMYHYFFIVWSDNSWNSKRINVTRTEVKRVECDGDDRVKAYGQEFMKEGDETYSEVGAIFWYDHRPSLKDLQKDLNSARANRPWEGAGKWMNGTENVIESLNTTQTTFTHK